MKFRLLVKLGELILGMKYSDDEPRADMFLPIWLLAFSLVLAVFGAVAGVYAIVVRSLVAGIVAGALVLLGAAALLCWRNQTVVVIDYDTFEYTTFLGNKKIYRFDEIRGLRRNKDSMTLFVGNGKVHIESVAIISDRFVARINHALEKLYGAE